MVGFIGWEREVLVIAVSGWLKFRYGGEVW